MNLKKQLPRKINKTLSILDPFKRKHKQIVILISYLPLFFITLVIFGATAVKVVSNSVTIDVVIIVIFGLSAFCFTGGLIMQGYNFLASLVLISALGILGLTSFFLWGLVHPIGFLLCLLSLRLGYILLNDSLARYINFFIFSIAILIGTLQLHGTLKYDYHWNPQLTILDFLVIVFLLWLFSIIALINSIGIQKHQEKIQKMKDKLYLSNIALQKEVVIKTKEVISNKTKLSKSIKTLQSAYLLLEDSEIDRFSKMNMLGHYGLMMTSVIHGMANPLMLIMTKLSKANFKGKEEIMTSVNELVSSVKAVRKSVRMDDVSEEITVTECIDDILRILDWRLKKEGITINKQFSGENFKLKACSSRFREIVLNLLNNSIESMSKSVIKEIELKYRGGKKNGKIIIENTGEQIPKYLHKRIFEIFYSTKSNSSGVGLYLSRKYAKDFFKGDIKLIRSNRKRTIFEFTFTR